MTTQQIIMNTISLSALGKGSALIQFI